MTESVFFQDLAVVLSVAGLAAALFSRFGWPKVFGYILVGVVMNGNTWGGSFLAEPASIRTLSQLGVVFLMFAMGLEFSTSDMKRIKGVTLPTALVDTVVMTWLGYMIGVHLLGWKLVPSLFLGGAVCDSATTLLAKMIGELGWSRRPFVKYVIGTSVCEDVICVGLIALVTGVAKGSGMSLGAVGASMGGLFLFFAGTIFFGLVLVPRLLKSVGGRGDEESLLLTALGICFFVAWAAYKLDYSLAIGAFLVGILGASSEMKFKLLQLVAPLKAMFAAMFFVSIGLLVDPAACWSHVGTILLVSAAVTIGKGVNCFVGAILCGQTVKTAVQMAMSLAQIGEFAFMVAILYVGISGDDQCPMFEVAIGASLLTTLLNPLLIRLSDPAGDWAERRCPARVNGWLDAYRAFLAKYRASDGQDVARRRVRRAIAELGFVALLEFTVAAGCGILTRVDWTRFSPTLERYEVLILLVVANVVMIVSLAPLAKIAGDLSDALNDVVVGSGNARWQATLRPIVRLCVFVAVFGTFVLVAIMINSAALPQDTDPRVKWMSVAFLAVVAAVVAAIGWRFFKRLADRARQRFEEALETDRQLADIGAMLTIQVPEGAFTRLTLPPGSPAVGGTVVTLNIRAKTGASVTSVRRGRQERRNVGPDWVFAAGDTLTALGDSDQIAALKELCGIP